MPTASNEHEPGEKELEEDEPTTNESTAKDTAAQGRYWDWM